jgi:hypothetical protein
MKERKLYWRRKGDRVILEGKEKKSRTIYLWTLPAPSKFIEEILLKSSFLTEEKKEKMRQKISRLEYREHKTSKMGLKVRTRNIMGTSEKDAERNEMDALLETLEEFE